MLISLVIIWWIFALVFLIKDLSTNLSTSVLLSTQDIPSIKNVVNFTMTMAPNPNKALTTSTLRFKVRNNNSIGMTINGLKFNNSLIGYVWNMRIVVYKNSLATVNIAWTSTIGTITGPITLTANNIIDARDSADYIVVIEGALADPNAPIQNRSVSLADAFFAWFNASAYPNFAPLPFTQTK